MFLFSLEHAIKRRLRRRKKKAMQKRKRKEYINNCIYSPEREEEKIPSYCNKNER
jgi:hypothetical protein